MLNSHDHPFERQAQKRGTMAREHHDSGGRGFVWLLAVVLAVIGLAAMARHGANPMVVVPVGISLFFMFMFMISHRRESKRIEASRRLERLERAARRALEPEAEPAPRRDGREEGMREQQFSHAPGVPYGTGASVSNDISRQVFDRFDVDVIELARSLELKPKEAASLLEFARDFVDLPHASALMRAKRDEELDRHLDAAIERAVLQYAISTNCEKMLKVTKSRSPHYADDIPF
jgi:hypothetical protein